jgi:hypothetical protein
MCVNREPHWAGEYRRARTRQNLYAVLWFLGIAAAIGMLSFLIH